MHTLIMDKSISNNFFTRKVFIIPKIEKTGNYGK